MNSQAFWGKLGNHRLLSAAEEVELGRRIQAGGEDGQRAKETLCLHNIRMLMGIAQTYRHRGIELEDLYQSAYIGLNRAAELYDPERGNKFSTYATMWIHQACQRVCQGADVIRLPDLVRRVRLTVSNEPDLPADEVARRTKATPNQVRVARKAAHVVASLDTPLGSGDEQRTAYDLVADEPEGESADTDWVRELLDVLNEDERAVIECLFGLNGYGGVEHTVDEVVTLTGMPQTRVKAFRASAIKKLREAAASS